MVCTDQPDALAEARKDVRSNLIITKLNKVHRIERHTNCKQKRKAVIALQSEQKLEKGRYCI